MLLGGVLSTYHVQNRFILSGFMENAYCDILIAPISQTIKEGQKLFGLYVAYAEKNMEKNKSTVGERNSLKEEQVIISTISSFN